MKHLILFLFIGLSLSSLAQQNELFRTVYYPAEPYGGPKELDRFIKQELVYPAAAKEKGEEGEVFVSFKVNSNGEVIFKQVAGEASKELQDEAERIFDRIVWEKDHTRSDPDLGFEKLKIKFALKKYARLVKKRGYDVLPMEENLEEISAKLYTINTADSKPVFEQDLNQLLKENFRYPNIAIQQNISGRVVLEFVIEPYGRASNIRVKDAVGGGCNEETARLVRMMRWKPAVVDGKPVRCLFEYQLSFVNPGGSIH